MIGSATSVLKDDFITAFENDEQFDFKSWLPKLKLPSQMDVLKLILFLRDEAGKNNHVEKIHQEYKRLLQNKNKTTPSFVKAREIFLMKSCSTLDTKISKKKNWSKTESEGISVSELKISAFCKTSEEKERVSWERRIWSIRGRKDLSSRGGWVRELLAAPPVNLLRWVSRTSSPHL